MGMMKRIHEQRQHDTIPAALRRWLLGNDENHHLVEPMPPIKGEGRRAKTHRIETIEDVQEAIMNGGPITVARMVQRTLFS